MGMRCPSNLLVLPSEASDGSVWSNNDAGRLHGLTALLTHACQERHWPPWKASSQFCG
jgi:hypothetical protein